MTATVDGYIFDFPGAKELYKFDETDNQSPHYHGVSVMKSVDVMAIFSKFDMWIEIKDYQDEEIQRMQKEGDQRKKGDTYHLKTWLRNNLVRKYRDTFLYRYAENKIGKPIIYVCLLNFDPTLLSYIRQELIRNIPCGIPTKRWNRPLIERLIVLDEKAWGRNKVLQQIGTCTKI